MAAVEILTVGDELLRGDLVDGNSGWLAGRLHQQGLEVARFQSVGDQVDEISDLVGEAARRCGALLITGGLGPTEDDCTAEALAKAADRRLVLDDRALEGLRARLSRVGLPLTDRQRRQARIPEGARVISNEHGTAPGFVVRLADCCVYCMPGVPGEMQRMFEEQVGPQLRERLGSRSAFRRTLKLFGLSESRVADRLQGLLHVAGQHPCEVSLHYRATFPEVHVTLVVRSAQGGQQDAARVVLETVEVEARKRLSKWLFAAGEMTYSEAVVEQLRQAHASVALAESCTGGLVGDLLTRAAGSSEVFELGVVAYANRIKQQVLGVPEEILVDEGAVSQGCVEAMARGVRDLAGATYGLAVSGIAGPSGGSVDKPVGTVHFALASEHDTYHLVRCFPLSRQRNKLLSAYVALWLLVQRLRDGAVTEEDPLSGRWAPGSN